MYEYKNIDLYTKSIISFKIYVDDASNPKAKKPKNKFSIISGESGSWDAIKGKKMGVFFIQWCKRRTSNKLIMDVDYYILKKI